EASQQCQDMLNDGAWGTAEAGAQFETGGDWIPNKNVLIYNNIFYNPDGVSSVNGIIAVNGSVALPGDADNIPDPALADEDLSIRGNVFWNGGVASTLLTSTNGSDPACEEGNGSCNENQLEDENEINSVEPELTDPADGDFTPVDGGNVTSLSANEIPNFTWDTWLTNADVPEGDLDNTVTNNFLGEARGDSPHPGAY
ncbi:MAG TPA: hypothetical protein VJC18_08755, partial [bacterium]|nr:hypothetical protein [bacterium]